MVESTTTPVSPISAPGPRDVVASFLKLTVDKPDLEKAKLHLTRRSVEGGNFHAASVPPGSTYTLGAEEADELGRRIMVNMKSPGADGSPQEMALPVIVIQEEGEWKVDLPATMDRMFGATMDAMGKAIGAVGEALSTAMTGVGEALSEGMGTVQASKPMKKAVAKEKAIVKAVKKAAGKMMKNVRAKMAKKETKRVKNAAKKPAKKASKKPLKKVARSPKKRAKKKSR